MKLLPGFATLLLLATLPAWAGGSYDINIASQVLIAAIFALGLSVSVGWAGLISLGHAALFGVASYALAWLLAAGWGQLAAALGALGLALVAAAGFALIALRATGIGFLMITLAIGEILWGVAYRWISVTNGDNGISIRARPAPFGLSLASPTAFYLFALLCFLLVLFATARLKHSPFGASLRGTRDQPQRMATLGYHVWLIRFLALLFSGLLSAVAGLLFAWYHQFVSPSLLSLQSSAEALLMVIAGGAATLLGPVLGAALVVIMKTIVSAYVERWNFLLGTVFVLIVLFMPDGLVPGVLRLWRRTLARLPSVPREAPR